MIIGLNINSIDAKRRENEVKGALSINSTPFITGVSKKDIADLKNILAVEFSFKVSYEPNAADIVFTGEVLYKAENTKDIIKKWEQDKTLDQNVSVEILNAVFRRCLIKATQLSEDLRLPPPVRFPIVAKELPKDLPAEDEEN